MPPKTLELGTPGESRNEQESKERAGATCGTQSRETAASHVFVRPRPESVATFTDTRAENADNTIHQRNKSESISQRTRGSEYNFGHMLEVEWRVALFEVS